MRYDVASARVFSSPEVASVGLSEEEARERGYDVWVGAFDLSGNGKDVATAGEENGVVFGYEANIWERTELGGFEGLLRMVDEVGSPHFGVYLHNAYPRAGLPLHEEVEKAGESLVKAMHSSSLVSGRVEIDFEKAFAAMKKYFTDGVYTFEIPWEEAEENKKLIDEMMAKYW
ncbi:MAG: hypothetical protein U9Q78_00975 [Chloroflexota bacterium]|nr:hypothetical protein [Chloroflexota bacterium]